MRLATIPATLWPPPEPRSRIVLFAWYPPGPGFEEPGGNDPAEPARPEGDCTSRSKIEGTGRR